MTKKDLWEKWADPSDWSEYTGTIESLVEEENDFYKDLDRYYDTRLVKEASEFIKLFKGEK